MRRVPLILFLIVYSTAVNATCVTHNLNFSSWTDSWTYSLIMVGGQPNYALYDNVGSTTPMTLTVENQTQYNNIIFSVDYADITSYETVPDLDITISFILNGVSVTIGAGTSYTQDYSLANIESDAVYDLVMTGVRLDSRKGFDKITSNSQMLVSMECTQ